jgi:hypothetical protein
MRNQPSFRNQTGRFAPFFAIPPESQVTRDIAWLTIVMTLDRRQHWVYDAGGIEQDTRYFRQ